VLIDHWPLAGLRLGSPRLELRLPTEDELGELADLAAEGIHRADKTPFLVSWPSLPPPDRARAVLQRHWLAQGNWSADRWSLNLAVYADGQIVGTQEISAENYQILRQVSSFSWLGLRYQSQGIGTEMRAAVLQLAFSGLGAAEATSGAFDDNEASLRISEKLGYEPDGIERLAKDGRPTTTRRLLLSRAKWERSERIPVSITGLGPCLPMFGLHGQDRP
jgi:RimJ/RimL family protein N-acetyltransferase